MIRPLLLAVAALAIAACDEGRAPSSPAPATTGTIRGTCRYAGAAKPATLPAIPGMGCDSPHLDGTLVESAAHALADCVVFLDRPEGRMDREPGRLRLVVEPCSYAPRVAAARGPLQLEVENRATHDASVHGYRDELTDTAFNLVVAPGATIEDAAALYLDRRGRYLLRCDTVASYAATLFVFDHPWFDVTSLDARSDRGAGGYALVEVPPGDHDVVCWHEAVVRDPVPADGRIGAYASRPAARTTRRVHVAAGETVTVDFSVASEGSR